MCVCVLRDRGDDVMRPASSTGALRDEGLVGISTERTN